VDCGTGTGTWHCGSQRSRPPLAACAALPALPACCLPACCRNAAVTGLGRHRPVCATTSRTRHSRHDVPRGLRLRVGHDGSGHASSAIPQPPPGTAGHQAAASSCHDDCRRCRRHHHGQGNGAVRAADSPSFWPGRQQRPVGRRWTRSHSERRNADQRSQDCRQAAPWQRGHCCSPSSALTAEGRPQAVQLHG
jgi:hypothetical protein